MADRTCSVRNCERGQETRGLCKMHYERLRTTGSVHLPTKRNSPPCSVDGCDKITVARGWCSKHYHRWRRHGDVGLPTRFRAVTGSTFRTGSGYLQTFDPDHPIATKNGLVSVHRKVLYDTIGSGWQLCHWCHQPVSWLPTVPRFARLVVDHLDDDRMNNDPANLVPACNGCNTRRGSIRWHADRRANAGG